MSSEKPTLLLDHSIITNTSCFEWILTTLNGEPPREDKRENLLRQIIRKEANANPALQSEIEAIYPLGQLMRTEKVQAMKSWELMMEGLRDYLGSDPVEAFEKCEIGYIPPPLTRCGPFTSGTEPVSKESQVQFMAWLCKTPSASVREKLEQWNVEGLSDYENESIEQLDWFKELCVKVRSPRNYPDAFHLWAAERAGLDYFLTLDGTFVRIVNQIRNEKKVFPINTKVMGVRAFLEEQGVKEVAPIPIAYGEANTIGVLANKLRNWPYDLTVM